MASLLSKGVGVLAEVGSIVRFLGLVLKAAVRRAPSPSLVIEQMIKIGLESFPVIMAICAFVGSNIVLVGYYAFQRFGGQDMVGAYSGLMCLREFAPIIVGAMMAAKPGTDMTATIATMRIREQIDALEVMSVNPFWFLMVPRFLAFILVAPCLIVFASIAAIAAGYVVAVFQLGVNGGTFVADLTRYLTATDLWCAMLKGIIFATLTCLVACYYGFNSAPGPQGVSRAINRTVVVVATIIVIVNYFLSEALFG
ncbi:ABC transporter permease [bacterium]|nr:ABC transporter permease [bacterium]